MVHSFVRKQLCLPHETASREGDGHARMTAKETGKLGGASEAESIHSDEFIPDHKTRRLTRALMRHALDQNGSIPVLDRETSIRMVHGNRV